MSYRPNFRSGENSRVLQSLTWASGQIISRDIPRDTILKRIQLRLSGTAVYTFASTPVAFEVSTFDNLVGRIDVYAGAGRLVKSVRPHLLHMEQLLATSVQAERRASAAASAALNNTPTADSGLVYGTSGQTTTVAETVMVSFEMVLADDVPWLTYLNLKNISAAFMNLTCGTTANLDKTTNATFTSTSFTIEIVLVEAQDVPSGQIFADWKQTTKDLTFTAQVTDSLVDINRGNLLCGLKIFTVQDAAGTNGTTAVRKAPTNYALDTLKLILNGSRIVKQTTFFNLQTENRVRFGITATFASNASRFDGFAYFDVLESRRLETAISLKPPTVDNAQLAVSTKASDSNQNNYNVGLTVETGELVTPA